MSTIGKTLLAVVLVASVLSNVGLVTILYERSMDLRISQAEVKARTAERDFLLNLAPELRPRISKSDLAAILQRGHPGEAVNNVGDHIQWRQFQFWFNKGGELEAVRWSS